MGLLWDRDEPEAMMTPAIHTGQRCSYRVQSHGTISGMVLATGPTDQPRQSKEINKAHSPASKKYQKSWSSQTSIKWQASGLEAGVKIKLYIS